MNRFNSSVIFRGILHDFAQSLAFFWGVITWTSPHRLGQMVTSLTQGGSDAECVPCQDRVARNAKWLVSGLYNVGPPSYKLVYKPI